MRIEINPEERRKAAEENFLQGYNCAQSILNAFADLLPEEGKLLLKAGSPLGGGMGRLREVCGAISASFLMLGALYGYDTPETGDRKVELYTRVQEVANAFEKRHETIVCRELLGLSDRHSGPVPDVRTPAYYDKRPCAALIGDAAEILANYISEHPTEE